MGVPPKRNDAIGGPFDNGQPARAAGSGAIEKLRLGASKPLRSPSRAIRYLGR